MKKIILILVIFSNNIFAQNTIGGYNVAGTGSGGGITEAPLDGMPYVRINGVWSLFSTYDSIVRANNGLTVNPSNNVQLGGTLIQPTTITQAGKDFIVNNTHPSGATSTLTSSSNVLGLGLEGIFTGTTNSAGYNAYNYELNGMVGVGVGSITGALPEGANINTSASAGNTNINYSANINGVGGSSVGCSTNSTSANSTNYSNLNGYGFANQTLRVDNTKAQYDVEINNGNSSNMVFTGGTNNNIWQFVTSTNTANNQFSISTDNLNCTAYPNSRNDVPSNPPINFLYTDAVGTILSAPISTLPSGGGGGPSYTAGNGLSLVGSDMELGGNISKMTNLGIAASGNLAILGNGTSTTLQINGLQNTTLNSSVLSVDANGYVFTSPMPSGGGGITTNTLTSATNTITSNVDGISSSANIINTNNLTLTGTTLSSEINGITSNVTLPNNTYTAGNGISISGTTINNTGLTFIDTASTIATKSDVASSIYSWGLLGNAGTTAGTNFIGTTDAQPIIFKVHNGNMGLLDLNSVIFGYNANSTSGNHNEVIIGENASANGMNSTSLIAIGNSATIDDAGNGIQASIAIGDHAKVSTVTDVVSNAIAIGTNALVTETPFGLGTSGGIAIGTNSNCQGFHSIAFGANASVTTDNTIRLGDANITTIEGQVPFTYPSDKRFKENIRDSKLGLDFILKLNPVTYNFNTYKYSSFKNPKKEYKEEDFKKSFENIQLGLLAQDVEESAKECGETFTGVKVPEDKETGTYSMSYTDLVMPLINSIKELEARIKVLEEKQGINTPAQKKKVKRLKKSK